LNAPYNDVPAAERLYAEHAGKIAAIIVEPVAANMGVVPPAPGFLESLRRVTARDGALLIFDEVITGFRLTYGGAQRVIDVQPDLTILGKIIGGGLPVAAYGGRREIMEMIAPLGPVYQAGTLSGNPLAMRAGLASLPELGAAGFYESLEAKARRLVDGLLRALKTSGIPGQVNVIGSLMTLFFASDHISNYGEARRSDTTLFANFFGEMLARGILLPPSQFEALFVSAAHTGADIENTIAAAEASLHAVSKAR
jgi:glutamate-1-semialdehyde 2,1-aminomutase